MKPPPGVGGGGGGAGGGGGEVGPPLGGGGGGGGYPPPAGGGGGKSDMRLPPHAAFAAGEPIAKLRTIHACIASAYAVVNRIPTPHATRPSDPTKLAAISIRPAIKVLEMFARAARSTSFTCKPPRIPPRSVARTIDGIQKLSARNPSGA